MKFKDTIVRLLKGTTIDEKTNCWLVNGTSRYHSDWFNGRTVQIHRISAHIYFNYDLYDTKHQINHKCHNKHCWNPAHLYVGTQAQNVQDSINRGTHGKINNLCFKKLHELTPQNTFVDSKGNRNCKACRKKAKRIYQIEYRNRLKAAS